MATGRARDGLAAGVSSGRTGMRSPGRIGSWLPQPASASASASAASGARQPHRSDRAPAIARAQPSTATGGAGGSIDPPAATISCRARACSASVAVGSASSGLRSAIAAGAVAGLEMHQRPLLERQRPERRAGRDQPLERRLPLGGVHRRAEQHHPLRAPRASARAGGAAPSPATSPSSRRRAVAVAGRLEAAGLRQPRQHRRARRSPRRRRRAPRPAPPASASASAAASASPAAAAAARCRACYQALKAAPPTSSSTTAAISQR